MNNQRITDNYMRSVLVWRGVEGWRWSATLLPGPTRDGYALTEQSAYQAGRLAVAQMIQEKTYGAN